MTKQVVSGLRLASDGSCHVCDRRCRMRAAQAPLLTVRCFLQT